MVDFELSVHERQLFDACIAAVGSTHDTPIGWYLDLQAADSPLLADYRT